MSTHLQYQVPAIAAPGFGGTSIRIAFAWICAVTRRVRQRHTLARLDDRSLRDIGITRTDALAEANKPFWQP